ncbi:23S rRNA (uracil(1939)-C(5))-methyltransferase RlmD [Lachnoclostridium sp. Marseille-P6806]|uniref:23S rRNA (uracil(1939)-C(5))-methyltransferase RlmD n=1 Tax=Lachnoclostridium sp. Marseille-P6806 TaxID=2364793 RepID=UPI001031C12C|nr:23S rRNA (uracil(1939)-C(5))-methyltransferase RlmD [Lachnoclostridium sp. Marseille-P6806]
MKKGEEIVGIIEYVSFPNRGIMHVTEQRPDGESERFTVTVKNTVPGQKVAVRIKKRHGNRAEGVGTRVLARAPEECDPPCPHFGLCGGCTWLNLPYEEEQKLKSAQVKALLDQAVSEDYIYEGIKASPRIFEYRNKMEFTFGDSSKDGPLELGQHRRGGFYDILTVTDCRIVDGDYRTILRETRDFWAALKERREVTLYHRLRHTGYLRHLLVRKASHTGEILIDIVTTSQEEHTEELRLWAERLRAIEAEGRIAGHIQGILHTTNDSMADAVEDGGTEILFGEDFFSETLLGLSFKVTPFSFFQTNSYSAEVLYETAREYLRGIGLYGERGKAPGPVVFDLYTGTGTIAQLMAPAAKKVVGVEIVEEAVRAARENAARNGLSNCEFIAGDVLKVLDAIEEKPDIIVLDPPRDGVHPKALSKILAYGVPYILYISCKPTSLARDLAGFYEAGYRLERVVAVDQFPRTANVETVVLLSHKAPDSHINVKVEFGEGKGKVPLDKIAERAEKYKPKEQVTYKKRFIVKTS